MSLAAVAAAASAVHSSSAALAAARASAAATSAATAMGEEEAEVEPRPRRRARLTRAATIRWRSCELTNSHHMLPVETTMNPAATTTVASVCVERESAP